MTTRKTDFRRIQRKWVALPVFLPFAISLVGTVARGDLVLHTAAGFPNTESYVAGGTWTAGPTYAGTGVNITSLPTVGTLSYSSPYGDLTSIYSFTADEISVAFSENRVPDLQPDGTDPDLVVAMADFYFEVSGAPTSIEIQGADSNTDASSESWLQWSLGRDDGLLMGSGVLRFDGVQSLTLAPNLFTLDPGRWYWLEVHSALGPTSTPATGGPPLSDPSAEISLIELPEPGACILVLSGAVALIRWRRKN